MVDYYNLLGIAPQATADEVRRAFRRRAKAVHPDAHADAPPPEQEALRRRFILLAQAYETLSDPARRAAYDRQRPPAGARAAPGGQAGPMGGAGRTGWRSTSARFGRARRQAPQPPPADENLEDLLRDVESLLGRFGLDLRQPLEALLETLLDWARAVFRQVMGGDEPPAAGARASRARPGATAGNGPSHRQRPAAGPQRRASAEASRMEAELEALRRRAAARPARAANADDVEAELRRLKERLGRQR